MSEAVVIEGRENIDNVRLLALRRMLSLEMKGLGRRGRSAYAIIKDEMGFKGSKQKVYDQLSKYLDENVLPKQENDNE